MARILGASSWITSTNATLPQHIKNYDSTNGSSSRTTVHFWKLTAPAEHKPNMFGTVSIYFQIGHGEKRSCQLFEETYEETKTAGTLLVQSHREVNRRSKLETYLDILRVSSAGALGPTHIMYKANLSWVVLQRYLKSLESMGLIEKGIDEERRVYNVTQKGFDLLRQYLSIREAITPF